MFEFLKPQELSFPPDAITHLNQMRAILDLLSDRRVRAVVGGGILRDLYMGAPFKDIDLFANASDANDEQMMAVLTEHGFTCRLVVSHEATEYLSFTDVSSVIEATHPMLAVPLQIIRMSANNDSGERMVERLDLGPCQIGMDHLGNFWTTRQFGDDLAAYQFTVTRSQSRDIERSTKRFQRLSLKYPGWTLVVPDAA